jgi:hypothetical protein
MEWKSNKNGMKMEWKWNENGIKIERKWNENRMKMKWKYNHISIKDGICLPIQLQFISLALIRENQNKICVKRAASKNSSNL